MPIRLRKQEPIRLERQTPIRLTKKTSDVLDLSEETIDLTGERTDEGPIDLTDFIRTKQREAYQVVGLIAPEDFIGWFREKYNIPAPKWTDSSQWLQASHELGITAAALSSGVSHPTLVSRHAYLILKVGEEKTELYDPFGSFTSVRTAALLNDYTDLMGIMLSANLDNERTDLNLNRPESAPATRKATFLQKKRYELALPQTPSPQRNAIDCGPLTLYAGLLACAQNRHYSINLKLDKIKEIPKLHKQGR